MICFLLIILMMILSSKVLFLITSVTFLCLLDLCQMISITKLKVTKDDYIDPDSNVYNVIDNDSKYYLPGEVKVAIDKLNICNEFSVLYINARSLWSKIDNPQVLLEVVNVKFDVIAASETWESDVNDQLLHIRRYTKISNKWYDGRMGGGGCLVCKE